MAPDQGRLSSQEGRLEDAASRQGRHLRLYTEGLRALRDRSAELGRENAVEVAGPGDREEQLDEEWGIVRCGGFAADNDAAARACNEAVNPNVLLCFPAPS